MNLLSSLTKHTCTALPTNSTWCTKFVSFFAGNRIVRGKMCACLSNTHIYRNELRMYCMAAYTPHASAVAIVVVKWVSSFRWWAEFSYALYTWADVWVDNYRTLQEQYRIKWNSSRWLATVKKYITIRILFTIESFAIIWPTQADRFCKNVNFDFYLFFRMSNANHIILPHFFPTQNGIECKSMKMNAIVWPTQWHNCVVHTIHHLFACVGLNVKERE